MTINDKNLKSEIETYTRPTPQHQPPDAINDKNLKSEIETSKFSVFSAVHALHDQR